MKTLLLAIETLVTKENQTDNPQCNNNMDKTSDELENGDSLLLLSSDYGFGLGVCMLRNASGRCDSSQKRLQDITG